VGWNGSNSGSSAVGSAPRADRKVGASVPLARNAPSFKKGIIAGLIVVIGAGLAAFIIGRGARPARPQSATKPATKQIAEVTPQIVTQAVEVAETPTPKPKAKSAPKRNGPNLRDPKLSDAKRDALYEKQLADMPIAPESTNRVFRTGTEQVMGWIFTAEVGDMPPPLPQISDFDLVHMQEILNMENPVRDTDSERAADAKETVDFAKKELKAYIEKGGDPQDFLQYYHDELKQAFRKRQEAQNQVLLVMKEDPDSALEYMEIVNKSLKEQGIKEVSVAPRTLKQYGITPPETTNEEGNN